MFRTFGVYGDESAVPEQIRRFASAEPEVGGTKNVVIAKRNDVVRDTQHILDGLCGNDGYIRVFWWTFG